VVVVQVTMSWQDVPEPVLLEVLGRLNAGEALRCGQVCRRWAELAHDQLLWKGFLCRDFHLSRNISRPPGTQHNIESVYF
jgi:hypothetical protein